MTFVLALVAAAVYGVGTALQQQEARSAPAQLSLRLGLLGRLARRPTWLAGLASDVVGFGLQTAALTTGSLVIVQPVLSTNLVFGLLVTAGLAHAALTRAQVRAALAVVVGLALLLAVSHPTVHSHAPLGARTWLVMVVLVGGLAATGAAVGAASSGPRRGIALGLAASAAEALMAVIAKAFGERAGHGLTPLLRSWEPYAVIGCGLTTLLIVQSAYQVGLPLVVLPLHAVGEPLLGVAIGIGLLHERVHLAAWRAPLVMLAAWLLVAGLVVLSRGSRSRHDVSTKPTTGGRT